MARTNSAVSVGVTATPLAGINPGRQSLWFFNNGAVTVYIGDANVTTVNGYPIPAAQSFNDNVASDDDETYTAAWYGIVASGTADVRVIEE